MTRFSFAVTLCLLLARVHCQLSESDREAILNQIDKNCAAKPDEAEVHCFGYSSFNADNDDPCSKNPSTTECKYAFATVRKVDNKHLFFQLVGKVSIRNDVFLSGSVGIAFVKKDKELSQKFEDDLKGGIEPDIILVGLVCSDDLKPKLQVLEGVGEEDAPEKGFLIRDPEITKRNADKVDNLFTSDYVTLNDSFLVKRKKWFVCQFQLVENANYEERGALELMTQSYKVVLFGNDKDGHIKPIFENETGYFEDRARLPTPTYVTSPKVAAPFVLNDTVVVEIIEETSTTASSRKKNCQDSMRVQIVTIILCVVCALTGNISSFKITDL